MPRRPVLKLHCHEGHWEQAAFTIRALADHYSGQEVWEVWMACTFGAPTETGVVWEHGGHWLAPAPHGATEAAGSVVDVPQPYAWASRGAAEWALAQWERQQGQWTAREARIDDGEPL